MSVIDLDQSYVANTYNRFPVVLKSGKGSLVYDENGKEYIDLGTGIAVNTFGIADTEWEAAVSAQLGTLQHTSNLFYSEPCALLAEQLCKRTGMKKVFFSNSGAEANECAIKVARKYAADRYGPSRHVILTLCNSFHGRTLTTLAATGQDVFHELFRPLTPGFVSIDTTCEALDAAVNAYDAAGILIEPVQGEGGVIALEEDLVKHIELVCREKDLILMVDEVQTGNGRCGALYAYMRYGIEPDVVTTAKGLGGGLPLGACMMGSRVENVLGFGDHGSTFGGNPACCAGALNVLSRIDDTLMREVTEKSDYIQSVLSGAPGVISVTGMGLMLGVETVRPVAEVLADCREKGVLAISAKQKVRLLPALNIPWELLKKSIEVLKEVCGNV